MVKALAIQGSGFVFSPGQVAAHRFRHGFDQITVGKQHSGKAERPEQTLDPQRGFRSGKTHGVQGKQTDQHPLLAVFAVFLLIVGKVFEELKNSDTPFTESIQKKLKITAILVTLMVMTESLGMAAIVALGFWCVYSVFGYGIELQKNEDETL